MVKHKKKLVFILVFVFAFLPVFSAVPVKADSPQQIHVTQTILNQVIANPKYYPDYGIESFDSGVVQFFKPVEYVLDTDLLFTGHCLDFSSEDGTVTLDLHGHTISCTDGIHAAVVCSRNPLIIKDTVASGSNIGTISVDDDTTNAVLALKELTIVNGLFKGNTVTEKDVPLTIKGGTFGEDNINSKSDVKAYGPTNITSGVFNSDVHLNAKSTINGGVINGILYTDGEVTINEGKFNALRATEDSSDVTINGGEFLCATFEAGKGVINNGNFKGSGSYSPVSLYDSTLTINNGRFGILTNQTPFWYCLFATESDEKTTLIINGGTFEGCTQSAIGSDISHLEINGGLFSGGTGGLLVFRDSDESKVYLGGGRYVATGPGDAKDPAAAIYISTKEDLILNENSIESLLKEGSCYVPKAEANMDMLNGKVVGVYSQKELTIAQVESDSDSEELTNEVSDILTKIQKGESVEGVTPELAAEIKAAIEEGKDIKVGMVATPINPADVASDVAEINKQIKTGENIAGYFDLSVAVSINGEVKGYITKLGDEVLFKLPIPDKLPPVADGYTRVFKIIRVHGGVTTEIEVQSADGYVSGNSSEYSTYALVYKDVVTSPNTGDRGFLLWIFALLGSAAIILVAKAMKSTRS